MEEINWEVTPEEMDLIGSIVRRAKKCHEKAAKAYPDGVVPFDHQGLVMDLIACHKNGCPLRLKSLKRADAFSLAHDVFGIHRHIDRATGKLMDCFSPRFSA